jgi:hypothetical protein
MRAVEQAGAGGLFTHICRRLCACFEYWGVHVEGEDQYGKEARRADR